MAKKQTSTKLQKILTSAKQLFATNGFKDVSLDKIAAQAGVSKGAIFHHFKNKLDLFQQVFSAEIEGTAQLFNETEYESAREKLVANLKLISNFLIENQSLIK